MIYGCLVKEQNAGINGGLCGAASRPESEGATPSGILSFAVPVSQDGAALFEPKDCFHKAQSGGTASGRRRFALAAIRANRRPSNTGLGSRAMRIGTRPKTPARQLVTVNGPHGLFIPRAQVVRPTSKAQGRHLGSAVFGPLAAGRNGGRKLLALHAPGNRAAGDTF